MVHRCLRRFAISLSLLLTALPSHAELEPLPADSGLIRFLDQLQQQNPELSRLQVELQALQSQRRSYNQPRYNPSLLIENEQPGVRSSVGLQINYDWHDRQGALQAVAGQQVMQQLNQLRLRREQLNLEALQALNHYHAAARRHNLAAERSQLMQRFAESVQRRRRVGDTSALDLALAKVAHSEAEMQQAQLQSLLIQAESDLQALSAAPADGWPLLPETLPIIPDEMPPEPELLRQLATLHLQGSHLTAAKMQILNSRRRDEDNPSVGVHLGSEQGINVIGFNLEIPLPLRNKPDAEVEAATQQALAAEISYREQYRLAQLRLQSSQRRFQLSREAWQRWQQKGQQALQQQNTLLERLWNSRELNAADYLTQAKQRLDTETSATDLLEESWQAAFDWLLASAQLEPWLGLTPAEVTP